MTIPINGKEAVDQSIIYLSSGALSGMTAIATDTHNPFLCVCVVGNLFSYLLHFLFALVQIAGNTKLCEEDTNNV